MKRAWVRDSFTLGTQSVAGGRRPTTTGTPRSSGALCWVSSW
ncbi:MAG: hypothetical protein QM820_59610 [Minicystis sp.]